MKRTIIIIACAAILTSCTGKTEKTNNPCEDMRDTAAVATAPYSKNDRSLFEVKGNVKQVQTIATRIVADGQEYEFDTTSVQFFEDGVVSCINQAENISFDHDGNATKPLYELTRNQSGRINSYTKKIMATPESFARVGYEYLYNEEGQLIKMITHGIESRSEYTYTYDGNGRIAQMLLNGQGEGTRWEYAYSYDYLASDEEGNWIVAIEKATYKTYGADENPNNATAKYTFNPQFRNIEYYDSNKTPQSETITNEIEKRVKEITFLRGDRNKTLSSKLKEALEAQNKYENATNQEWLSKWKKDAKFPKEANVKVSNVLMSACGEVYATILIDLPQTANHPANIILLKFVKENGKWMVEDYYDDITSFTPHLDLTYKFGIRDGGYLKTLYGNFNGDGCIEQIWLHNPQKDGKDAGTFSIISAKVDTKPFKSDSGQIISSSVGQEFINTINAMNMGDINHDGKDELGVLYHNPDRTESHYTVLAVNDKGEWQCIIPPFPVKESLLKETDKLVEKIQCTPDVLKILTHAKNADGTFSKTYKEITLEQK